ncbi:hypothetical protein Asi02nite_54600 [Asanoa siamensis]|uniref:DUF2510 domain-containing protein n=1 Tax=Asanoa siamensis TaxID=926357 RepID=A0ABQ4CXC5_9ACTN|nr:hypothetical protein Asi02nite_54600 [Asanoa siamensis]
MTERRTAVIAPRAGGWAIYRDGHEWTAVSQTPEGQSIRLDCEQLMELTCATLTGDWPAYVHWLPDRSRAAVHSAVDGAVLWCDRAQMDIVRTQHRPRPRRAHPSPRPRTATNAPPPRVEQ